MIVANEHANRGVVRKLSRKTRRLQVVKHTMEKKTAGPSCLDLTHCAMTADRRQWRSAFGMSATVLRASNQETNSWRDTLPSHKCSNDQDIRGEKTSIARLQTFEDLSLQSET